VRPFDAISTEAVRVDGLTAPRSSSASRDPGAEPPVAEAPGGDERAFHYYPCLGRVREHVIQNLGDEITLTAAAAVAGLEYHHFSRFFHERVGLCFRDWVCALRVARAMELLAQRDQPISWVGDTVGFADRRTLQRAFRRWLGMTPREFRRLARPRPMRR
jgi:AraC-like DNA-binding protein